MSELGSTADAIAAAYSKIQKAPSTEEAAKQVGIIIGFCRAWCMGDGDLSELLEDLREHELVDLPELAKQLGDPELEELLRP